MLFDILKHIRFCSCRETSDRRQITITGELLDKPRDVEIIRAKISAPFGKAMRLVEDPSADLALSDCPAKRLIAKLLRRDQKDAYIS
ncbi:hypothetical protein D9M68_954620 [compost metagenome]